MIRTDETFRPSSAGLFRRTLRRRWVPILALGLILGVALTAVVTNFVRPAYRSSSLIRVEAAAGVLDPEPDPNYYPLALMQTQVQMLTSPNVLSAAANNPKVASLARIQQAGDPIIELRKMIQVEIRPETFLIEVSMTSESASEPATVVNAAVDAYMMSVGEWTSGMVRHRITSLESYLEDLTNQAHDYESRWKSLAARQQIERDAARPGLMDAHHARLVREKLAENDIKRMEIQARLEALRSRKNEEDSRTIGHVEIELEAANILDRTLKARLTPSGDEARAQADTEVDLVLVKQSRESLNAMREAVIRRLEKLKFESAHGGDAIRPINTALPSGKPISDARPAIMAIVPFASLALAFAFFAGIESLSTGRGPKASILPEV